MNDKYCIFHIPNYIDAEGTSGSQIRPRKMIKAFEDIGYKVDVVMGYGAERKQAIKRIKKNIKEGIKYDFLYSESSTMPTILTEKNHIPRFIFLDFGFFRFCKNNHIHIGLFYRDIYWKFPIYKESVKGVKCFLALLAYRYDLCMYCKLLDAFFVPNKKMVRYINKNKLSRIMNELPPGCEYNIKLLDEKHSVYIQKQQLRDLTINLFYVGGIGNQYIFDELLLGIKGLNKIRLTICCREKEWENNKERLLPLMTERVQVVHKTGEQLVEEYLKADIALAFFKPDEYRDMAMPIKLFECLAYSVPILASQDTATGEFVTNNRTGWSINYDANQVRKLFIELENHYDEIVEKHENCRKELMNNRWIDRAELVKKIMMGDKNEC